MTQFKRLPVNFNYVDLPADTESIGRVYTTPTGEKYPSITTILGYLSKDGIDEWRERVGEEEADRIMHQAARRGTAVHEALECYLDNIEPTITNPLHKAGFLKIKKVLDKNVDAIYAQEKALYSKYLGVAGRVDLVARWKGKRAVIDFKNTRKSKKAEWCEHYFMQECFYAIAWEEQTGQPVQQLVTIIASDEDPVAQVYEVSRDEWAPKLVEVVKNHHEKFGTTHLMVYNRREV